MKRGEARAESDDAVRADLPADLVPVFDWARSKSKATLYQTRTEAFLTWVGEHTDEIAAWQAQRAEDLGRAAIRGVQRAELQAEADRIGKPAGLACVSCPARDAVCVRPEPARSRAKLAIVGEGPGRTELEEGRPFVGASGRMLARGLRTLGLQRSEVHWTNAVLCECRPRDLGRAAKACGDRLRAELADVAAPVVMPVGAYGLQGALGLTRKPQILRWRGSITAIEALDAPRSYICPTVHPAFVMRSPAWAPILELDLERVGRVLRDGWCAPEAKPGVRGFHIARDVATLQRELAALGPVVGLDVETVGLGPTETALVCLALSDGVRTVVIPWSLASNGIDGWWPAPPAIAAEITAALRHRVAVTHNGPAFDHIVLARYGIRVVAWEDTMLLAHARTGHMPKNLAHVVTQVLDVPPWKQAEHASTIEKLWGYNAQDTLYTKLAWDAMTAQGGSP